MVSFSTTDDRVQKINTFVKAGFASDRSTFINKSIDHMFKTLETTIIIDFMYFISIPLLFFLITLGITLYFASVFFYLLMGIAGIYLMVFVFMFYNKYRGVKWHLK